MALHIPSSYWSPGAAGPVLSLGDDGNRRGDWQDLARCSDVDPDLFFPDDGMPAEPARRICRNCEVRAQCLQFALDNNEEWGVWGGLSRLERYALRRQAA